MIILTSYTLYPKLLMQELNIVNLFSICTTDFKRCKCKNTSQYEELYTKQFIDNISYHISFLTYHISAPYLYFTGFRSGHVSCELSMCRGTVQTRYR